MDSLLPMKLKVSCDGCWLAHSPVRWVSRVFQCWTLPVITTKSLGNARDMTSQFGEYGLHLSKLSLRTYRYRPQKSDR